ncbi:DUF3794 domain-containing protein [Neobittarella massiliensis]|uniref:DUF3794 domain-containing protein n=1 Tax=Neobittarella massiliensis (ex Bilen et al. 2018) TaxID=2041842 RepID=A0A8J6ILB5_9FIRM|nr:SPOCS domain-containing protein [Neobittarella massiliensis]MBC3515574.1 DUF3794 domain-containing protein [Neobittarella massiliensis]
MELKKDTRTYQLGNAVLDKTFEQTVESDFILPDYLAEIVRIVKCIGTPHIVNKQKVDSKVILDGYLQFTLLYTSEDSSALQCFEQTIPFTKQIDCKVPIESDLVETAVKGEYINCRATNPRAISVRSSVSIRVKVSGVSTQTVLSDVQGGGIQQKKEEMQASFPAAMGQKLFSAEDETDLALNGSVRAVIGAESRIEPGDYKVITNKVIIKGECKTHVTYLMEDGSVQTADYVIPVSQVVDIDGCTSDMQYDVRLAVLDSKVELKQNIEGENTVLSTQIVGEVTAICFEQTTVETIRDVFSTTYDYQYKTKPFACASSTILAPTTVQIKKQLHLDGAPIETIYDVWGELNLMGSRTEGENVVSSGTIKVTVLGRGADEVLQVQDKNLDCELRLPAGQSAESAAVDLNAQIATISWSLGGDGAIELQLDIACQAVLTQQFSGNVVEDVTVDEETVKEVDKNTALTIYYCDTGEEVWQIAKRYNTSVDAIMQSNDLEDDRIGDKRTLLIPIVSE